MLAIQVKIVRFTDDWFPGFVECSFVDALGQSQVFNEKVPVVSREDLSAESEYPREGIIACRWIESRVTDEGREVVTVDTGHPWGVESVTGQTRFEVFREQTVEWQDD